MSDQVAAPPGLNAQATPPVERRPAHSLSASGECVALIKRFEEFKPRKYYCPAGLPTIGYGHVIQLHEVDLQRGEISEAQADLLLRKDLRVKERALWLLVSAPVRQCEYDALLSLVYNAGPGVRDGKRGDFADSTLLELLNRGEYALAAAQFDRWVYSRGKRLNGLIRRRFAERALFEGGDWRAADAQWLANYQRGAS